jgi:hypothetical protein
MIQRDADEHVTHAAVWIRYRVAVRRSVAVHIAQTANPSKLK